MAKKRYHLEEDNQESSKKRKTHRNLSKDKVIKNQAEEIKRLKKLLADSNKEKMDTKARVKELEKSNKLIFDKYKKEEIAHLETTNNLITVRKKLKYSQKKREDLQQNLIKVNTEKQLSDKRLKQAEKNIDSLQKELDKPQACSGQIDKNKISIFLSQILDIDIYKNDILINILDHQFQAVGRPNLISGHHQMRHIIPFAIVKELVKSRVEAASSPSELLNFLSESIIFFIQKEGLCLKESDLNTTPYKKAISVKSLQPAKKLVTENETYLLFDKDIKNIVNSPLKTIKAQEEYKVKIEKFIKYSMEHLQQAILDSNTKIMASEALAKIIFILFNTKPNTAFPEEGNTINTEIRLYTSTLKAKKGDKAYEVVNARELKKLIADNIDYNYKIRIVKNEGDMVKKFVKTLTIFDTILYNVSIKENCTEEIQNYNKNFNLQIKLTNYDMPHYFKDYNKKLKEKNIEKTLHKHIAKHLYSIFDFKPLERDVFVPLQKSDITKKSFIKVYPSAKGNKYSSYGFKEGKEYREEQIQNALNEHKYNKKITFRDEEIDQNILTEKAITLVYIAVQLFDSYKLGFKNEENFPLLILETFSKLLCADYGISHKEFYDNFLYPEAKNRFEVSTEENSENSEIDVAFLGVSQNISGFLFE